MYIPVHYRETDRARLLEFMRANSFATLVSAQGESLIASHLPFVIDNHVDSIVLRAHMAMANAHWKCFAEGREALVIFQGPHAYITPDWYESQVNVPTWNYATVHAYGVPRTLSGAEAESVVTAAITLYQSTYQAQYAELPPDFRRKMLGAIVAFEIPVTRLEGKYKLSQNKTDSEQHCIADALTTSPDQMTAQTGVLMHENLKPKI